MRPTRAEAINYAPLGWTLKNYLPCDSDFDYPSGSITLEDMQLKDQTSQHQAAEGDDKLTNSGRGWLIFLILQYSSLFKLMNQ